MDFDHYEYLEKTVEKQPEDKDSSKKKNTDITDIKSERTYRKPASTTISTAAKIGEARGHAEVMMRMALRRIAIGTETVNVTVTTVNDLPVVTGRRNGLREKNISVTFE
jgi:hypothetical protein